MERNGVCAERSDHNRSGPNQFRGCLPACNAIDNDRIDRVVRKVFRLFLEQREIAVSKPVFEGDILALEITEFVQPSTKGVPSRIVPIVRERENTYARDLASWLLRIRHREPEWRPHKRLKKGTASHSNHLVG